MAKYQADKQSYGNDKDMHQMSFIERFFKALVYNYVFDAGLYINNGNDICYCPCSRQVSSKWMNTFQIDLRDSCNHKRNKVGYRTPEALMNHSNSVGDLKTTHRFLHTDVATYLKHVHKQIQRVWFHPGYGSDAMTVLGAGCHVFIVGNMIQDTTKIFIPVNFCTYHWVLVVIVFETKQINYYDSLHADGRKFVEAAIKFVMYLFQKYVSYSFDVNEWEVNVF